MKFLFLMIMGPALMSPQAYASCGGFVCDTFVKPAVEVVEGAGEFIGGAAEALGGAGHGFAEMGKDLDRRRRKLQVALNDVATFGASVNARKKAKAEADEDIARLQRDNTAAAMAKQLRNLQELKTRLANEKKSNDAMIEYVAYVEKRNEENVVIMRALFDSINSDRSQLTQIQRILTSQRNDIYRFVNFLGLEEIPEKTRINIQINRQLAVYDEQLKHFPTSEVSKALVASWYNSLVDTYARITSTVMQIKSWLLSERNRIANDIRINDLNIKTLTEKTKKPVPQTKPTPAATRAKKPAPQVKPKIWVNI